MFGKSYESKYTGSLVGAGAMRFAVWDFVITTQKPSREWGSVVEVNPILLAAILGESVEDVSEAIEFLCKPDLKSRSKGEGGRRMVKLGEFLYRVVNGAKYRAMRDNEERRTQNREAQRRFVQKKRGIPLPGEARYVAAGSEEERDRIAAEASERVQPKPDWQVAAERADRVAAGDPAFGDGAEF